MVSGWTLGVISVAYIGLLFLIASLGDQRRFRPLMNRFRPWIYSVALAVYCTSWTFYGAVGQASTSGWTYFPIYLGPILMFAVFWPFLARIIRVSKDQNITSIADLISSRFGKSRLLAVTVTTIAVIGILPYIALQLKAVSMSFAVLTEGTPSIARDRPILADTAFYISGLLALFTILFGTRHVDSSESHRGMVLAVAFESVIKLLALVAIGLFCMFGLSEAVPGLRDHMSLAAASLDLYSLKSLNAAFLAQTGLAMCAMFCLPRQFHIAVVENRGASDLRMARWIVPIYMILISIIVIPIALAGTVLLGSSGLNPDTYVLTLPLAFDQELLAILAFIGGFSAATGMVIVSTVALSTMVCNDLVMPLILRGGRYSPRLEDLSSLLKLVRRITIVVLLLLAYSYYRYAAGPDSLAALGLLSFVAAAQFAPAVLAGLYWRNANRLGVAAGLIAGFALWIYTLLLPSVSQPSTALAALLNAGPFGIVWLRPQALFGIEAFEPLTHGVIWSLGVNVALLALVSSVTRQRVAEQFQAAAFIGHAHGMDAAPDSAGSATVGELRTLLERLFGKASAQRILDDFGKQQDVALAASVRAPRELIQHVERTLAGLVGASSAKLLLETALRGSGVGIADVAEILGGATQKLEFNRDVLQATLENISQGVSVVDADLRLVAWNSKYLHLFAYPDGFIHVGKPIAKVIRYNAERGYCGPGDAEELVARRMQHLRLGNPHRFEREREDGTVLEMRGNPIPAGGFVTSFTDVTTYKRVQLELEQAKSHLEQRVEERTRELSELNRKLRAENEARAAIEDDLVVAKLEAERANLSKTRFLAAASHDLLQPMNAARLFTAAVTDGVQEPTLRHGLERIDTSLRSAEQLLTALLDISRLDAGGTQVRLEHFPADEILQPLFQEFEMMASRRGLALHYIRSRRTLRSDRKLLRRIVQNLLSNAIRYTDSGRVVLGCRGRGARIAIEIHDTGSGIPPRQQKLIFEEFRKLRDYQHDGEKNMGLGLAIVERSARLLDHAVELESEVGRGSIFRILVEKGRPEQCRPPARAATPSAAVGQLDGASILCLDDDPEILAGLTMLLGRWGAAVTTAETGDDAIHKLQQAKPRLILADYHLEDGLTGLEVAERIRELLQDRGDGQLPPIIITTADRSDAVTDLVRAAGHELLHKPVRPATLRALINQLLSVSKH